MATSLRALGILVIVLALGVAGVAAWQLAADTRFPDVVAAYGRHPDHPIFEAEYVLAAARHYGLLAAVAGSLFAGVVFGALLLGLGEVLRRLPPGGGRPVG